MATYLTNSIIDYSNRTIDTYDLEDYFSINFKTIYEYVEQCDEDFFDWVQIQNNVTLEKLALDFYGNANYWDVLLVINQKNPLFEMPFDFDSLSTMAEDKIDSYIREIYNNDIPVSIYNIMYEKYKNDLVLLNEEYRIIRIVRPGRIQEFFQKGYEMGCFS